MHGYSTHCEEEWALLGNTLCSNNDFAFFAFDQENHGRTCEKEKYGKKGPNAKISNFHSYYYNYLTFVTEILKESKFDSLPVFFIGESIGGAIVLSSLIKMEKKKNVLLERIKGVICVAPAIQLKDAPIRLVGFALKVGSFIMPNAVVGGGGINNNTNLKEMWELYKKDPYVSLNDTTLTDSSEIYKLGDNVWKKMKWIKKPILIFHGTSDSLIEIKGSKTLYDWVESKDKTFIKYSKCKHCLNYDINSLDMVDTIEKWIKERIPSSHKKHIYSIINN